MARSHHTVTCLNCGRVFQTAAEEYEDVECGGCKAVFECADLVEYHERINDDTTVVSVESLTA
jgi:hypothetical protein